MERENIRYGYPFPKYFILVKDQKIKIIL